MQSVLHKADSRGHADHGWLDTYHTFSFANYYDPDRMHFGALRVLNDDTVAPGMGFGKHPHDNMEIISIPLSGDLEHGDSIGNEGVIREGDIQVMSAGTGIIHSERNRNRDKKVNFLQIWIFPNKQNVEPRYDQISLKDIERENEFYQVLSPNQDDQGVWIHQNAWFFMGNFTQDWQGNFDLKNKANGVYFFVLEGEANIVGEELSRRDGLGVWETGSININAKDGTRILAMEVPMNFN
ncbi:MAG: pirin family protein [Bacteroidales bacterium]|nr:pirin family protein [Bacteroidales bacterium]